VPQAYGSPSSRLRATDVPLIRRTGILTGYEFRSSRVSRTATARREGFLRDHDGAILLDRYHYVSAVFA